MSNEALKETPVIPIRLDVLDKDGKPFLTNEYVKEKIVLGRILSADLRIDDPRVSRIHALLEVRGDTILVTDLASSHGTFVNGQKIVEQKVKFGDMIRLGFVDVKLSKGSGRVTSTHAGSFEGRPVFEGEETLVNIDRAALENWDRRAHEERRKKDAFPDEQRFSDRRQGDRRIDQRKGERRASPTDPANPMLPLGVEEDRRDGSDRRAVHQEERRVGERRRGDRRVFDITSLERRIEDRRVRKSDDDVLPEELEKAFDPPEHGRELEVTVLWGDHILDVSNYAEPMVLSVGESPRNDHIIPSVGIPDEFPLVSIEEDGTAHLAFTDKMTGTVRAREKIYSVGDLKSEKFVKQMGEHFVVPMKQDDFAKIAIGNISFFILYVKPAPRIRAAPLFERDPLLLRTTIGSLLFLLALTVGLAFVPKPTPVTIEMMPEPYRQIVIKKRPVIAKQGIVVKGEESKEGGSKMGEGGPAIGPEGEAGKPNLPRTDKKPQTILPKSKPMEKPQVTSAKPTQKAPTVPTERERKLIDQKKAKSSGLLGVIGQSNMAKDLKSIIDKGEGPAGPGGFDDFGKAVRGHRGNTIEDTGGAGGLGVKGVGTGGGGKTVGIDGPSTKGLGRGYYGDGIGEGISGPGRLGQKGEHAISIISENVQVLSGLPKDVINAVVQRHRQEIRACYDSALQRNPGVRGKVTVAFTISPGGVVTSTSVKESTVGDASLERCITSRVATWIFPKPEAPVETVVSAYPFYLNPAN